MPFQQIKKSLILVKTVCIIVPLPETEWECKCRREDDWAQWLHFQALGDDA